MGLAMCSTEANTNAERMMLTGICHVIIFFQSINAKPNNKAKAHTSPIVPAPPLTLLPSNRCSELGIESSTDALPELMAFFIRLSGVAPVVASV